MPRLDEEFPLEVRELLEKLAELAESGPLPAVGHGPTAVGMTLLHALGISHDSKQKPNYRGVVVNARRKASTRENRVNLFAKVPEWSISSCKSSTEIVSRYGDDTVDGGKRLFCTVTARRPNSHGLILNVDSGTHVLSENFVEASGNAQEVAKWSIETLKTRLLKSHPATIWVTANSTKRDGLESFHYRRAEYTGLPDLDVFAKLLAEGTVTVDHLISRTDSGTREKGPLFKIKPSNISMLFPNSIRINLLGLSSRSPLPGS